MNNIYGKVEVNNVSFMLTTIYGLHSISDRGKLWPSLGIIVVGMHCPSLDVNR